MTSYLKNLRTAVVVSKAKKREANSFILKIYVAESIKSKLFINTKNSNK
jgi:hypothetical protein